MSKQTAVTPPTSGEGASLLPADFSGDATSVPGVSPTVSTDPASTGPDAENSGVVEAIVVPPAAADGTDAAARRARGLANLRPWPKGTSGNANGRPKGIVSKALTKELKRKIAASGETMLQALVSGYVAKALEEQDPARFNSIRDTVDGRPVSQDDGTGAAVGIVVQLEIVGK